RAMTLETAVEFAAMLTAADSQTSQPPPGLAQLSARERELVILVAQGRTDAQIAAQLFIGVSTVRSHLERIRDKTGCRRRADLTRLALQTGLVYPGPGPAGARATAVWSIMTRCLWGEGSIRPLPPLMPPPHDGLCPPEPAAPAAQAGSRR